MDEIGRFDIKVPNKSATVKKTFELKNLNMFIIFLYSVVAFVKERLDTQFTHLKLIIFITETVDHFLQKLKSTA